MKRTFLIFLFVLGLALALLPPRASAQAITALPVAVNQDGSPVSGALVTVCATNPGTGSCSSLVTLYTDGTLSHACTGNLQPLSSIQNPSIGSECSNPGFGDARGNVIGFASPGNFWCQYSGATLQTYTQPCATPGSGGGGGSTTIYQEVPSGAVDGSNVTFTLSHTPGSTADVSCFENGLQQVQGPDYGVSGTSLIWVAAPLVGYRLNCIYIGVGSSTNFNQGAPSGAVDGSNLTFTLAPAPASPANVNCFENGLQQLQGSGNDYTISGATLTYQTAPPVGTRLNCVWF